MYSRCFLLALGSAFCLCLILGCRTTDFAHDAEYVEVIDRIHQSWRSEDPAAEAVNPVVQQLSGVHPVEEYIEYALWQNPNIQAARMHVESLANRVPQAASLQDPMLGAVLYPEQIQTAAGQQELQLQASQKLPWFDKLNTRSAIAEEAVEAARAKLAAQELKIIENVKRAYYELYYIQKANQITEDDKLLLEGISLSLERRSITSLTPEHDSMRARLELSNLEKELIILRRQREQAQARLALVLHISPDTPLKAADQLPQEQAPQDLQRIYRLAVASRPELHAQLSAVMADRRKVDLAKLNYYPDLTLAATWIDTSAAGISPVANGRDSFLIGLSVNLPIYRKRLEAGVREAEAQAVASSREYDSLRDQTLEEIKELFILAKSQEELIRLFQTQILVDAEDIIKISDLEYRVGKIDFQQWFENWRQLLRFQIALQRLETDLRQTTAKLDQVVGGNAGRDER